MSLTSVGIYEFNAKDLIGHGAFAVVYKGRLKSVSEPFLLDPVKAFIHGNMYDLSCPLFPRIGAFLFKPIWKRSKNEISTRGLFHCLNKDHNFSPMYPLVANDAQLKA